jgi:sulfotransferase family protein
MRRPDFFIVGAPKCGTTAMYEFLKQHPQIFMPRKEIDFFGSDLYVKERIRDESAYLQLFATATNDLKVGEVSVWYLYSKRAAAEIKQFVPDARIIIQLRDPANMISSLHSELRFSGVENVEDFESALEAEINGRVLPFWNGPQVGAGMRYYEAGNYSTQVERYLKAFGREKVKVIIFDDLRENPLHVYRETCEFLAVRTDFEPVLRVINPNKKIRSKTVRKLMRNPPEPIKVVGRKLLTTPSRRQALVDSLQRLNTKYLPRPPMSRDLSSRLQRYFAPDIERLSKLLDRDLTYWCQT